jgi:ABC-type transport system substrate-binding protein
MVLALVLTSCGGSDEDGGAPKPGRRRDQGGEPQRGGELVVARSDAIDGWVPDAAIAPASYETLPLVMEPLLRFTDDGTGLMPGLASSVEPDATSESYTVTLQEGAAFSDGTPVTSADVAFSVQQWKEGALFGSIYSPITAVETPDDKTAVLRLEGPNSFIEIALSWANAAIIPKDFGGMAKDDFYRKPIGAGPFMIESERPGEQIVLTRNPHYYEPDRPYLDKVTFNVVADSNERVLQYESDDVDLLETVPADAVAQLPSEDVLTAEPSAQVVVITGNAKKAPWNDVEFRKAVSLAVNRDDLIESVYAGLGSPPKGVIPPSLPNSVPGECDWSENDPDAAASALEASAYDSDSSLTLLVDSARGVDSLAAEAIAGVLGDIGIQVRVERVDFATFIGRLLSGDFDLAMGYYTAISPSAGDVLSFIATSSWIYTGFDPTQAVEAFEAFSVAESDAERDESIEDVENFACEELPLVPLLHPDLVFAAKADVRGLAVSPFGLYHVDRLWLAR